MCLQHAEGLPRDVGVTESGFPFRGSVVQVEGLQAVSSASIKPGYGRAGLAAC